MAFASLKETIKSWFVSEPLGIEHGGTGSNSVDVVSKIEELESAWDSVSPMNDYVVEQGTSGSWYYRKWSSGRAECYITVNYSSVEITQAWGSICESNSLYYLTYPFTFASKPYWVISANESNGGILSIEAEGSGGSTTTTASFRFTRGNSSTNSVTFSCVAFGWWK